MEEYDVLFIDCEWGKDGPKSMTYERKSRTNKDSPGVRKGNKPNV